MATLYRNFPNRRALLEALYADDVDEAYHAAAAATTNDGPGAALRAWLRRFFAFFTSKRRVGAALLEQLDRSNPVFDDSRARVLAAARPLRVAAQQANEMRADLTLE